MQTKVFLLWFDTNDFSKLKIAVGVGVWKIHQSTKYQFEKCYFKMEISLMKTRNLIIENHSCFQMKLNCGLQMILKQGTIIFFLHNSLLTSLLCIPVLLCSIKMKFNMSLKYTLSRCVYKFHKNRMGGNVIVTSFRFSPKHCPYL